MLTVAVCTQKKKPGANLFQHTTACNCRLLFWNYSALSSSCTRPWKDAAYYKPKIKHCVSLPTETIGTHIKRCNKTNALGCPGKQWLEGCGGARLFCPWIKLKLLASAVQGNFEMEISELWAEDGCDCETDDSISSVRCPIVLTVKSNSVPSLSWLL